MKPAPILLILAAVAFAAAAGGCAWIVNRYAPGYSPAQMFLNADAVSKLTMLLNLTLGFGALVLGLVGLLARKSARVMRVLLVLIAAGSASLGLLAAMFSWMNIQIAVRNIGGARFEITAPSYAEALFALSVGLFAALIALGFNALLARRG